jgi:hypothetical protein
MKLLSFTSVREENGHLGKRVGGPFNHERQVEGQLANIEPKLHDH